MLVRIAVLVGMVAVLGTAQDTPPVPQNPKPADQAVQTETPTPAPVLENTGKPMSVPFQCTEEDIRSAGLACSEDDPCQIYLELAALATTGTRIFAAGNLHAEAATLYSVLLGSEDSGRTWREVYQRVRGAGLDHLLFVDGENGFASGLRIPSC